MVGIYWVPGVLPDSLATLLEDVTDMIVSWGVFRMIDLSRFPQEFVIRGNIRSAHVNFQLLASSSCDLIERNQQFRSS